jgi:hypothetical protein
VPRSFSNNKDIEHGLVVEQPYHAGYWSGLAIRLVAADAAR